MKANKLVRAIDGLGRCGFCMRTALQIAILAWALCAAIALVSQLQKIVLPSVVVASMLSVLWLAHIVAFALRASHDPVNHRPKRRWFARKLLLGMAVTLFPTLVMGSCRCKVCVAPPGFETSCCAGNAMTPNCNCSEQSVTMRGLCCDPSSCR